MWSFTAIIKCPHIRIACRITLYSTIVHASSKDGKNPTDEEKTEKQKRMKSRREIRKGVRRLKREGAGGEEGDAHRRAPEASSLCRIQSNREGCIECEKRARTKCGLRLEQLE